MGFGRSRDAAHLNLGALAVGVTGAWLMACAAQAGPIATYQHLVGDPNNVEDQARGVLELSVGDEFVTTGARVEFEPTFRELQLVTRHNADGSAIWSFASDWSTQRQFALEAIELSTGDLAVVGISRKEFGGAPGPDPTERTTLMVMDQNGALSLSTRYPGGSLPLGNSFGIGQLTAQAAIVEAPILVANELGGLPTGPDVAIASLNRTQLSDPFEGQFLRINTTSGNILNMVRYREPVTFNVNLFALFDVEVRPTNETFMMVGQAARRLDDGPFNLSPVLLLVDAVGTPSAAYLYPILAPAADPIANESVAMSIVHGFENEAYIAGFSDFYRPGIGSDGAFVMRVDLSTGVPDWIRVIDDFIPSVRSLSLNALGELALTGDFRAANPEDSGPALVVLDLANGAISAAMQYMPSGFARLNDAIAPVAGGWLLAGRGSSSGFATEFPPFEASRGGPGPNTVEIMLIRTDGFASSGCHERPIELVSELVQVDPIPFTPATSTPQLPVASDEFEPIPVEMALEDDCSNLPCRCFGDANGSLNVNFADVTAVLGNWLTFYGAGDTGPGDANCDSNVNFGDVTAVLGNWLKNCMQF